MPVLGFRTDELPLFYAARGGPPASARVESAEEAARVARAHWALGGTGLLLARPPDESLDDVEPLIEEALERADADGRARRRGHAVRALLPARAQRRPHAAREPRARASRTRGLAGEVAAAT